MKTPRKWRVLQTSDAVREAHADDRWTAYASNPASLDPNSDAACIDGGAWPTMQAAMDAARQGFDDEMRSINGLH